MQEFQILFALTVYSLVFFLPSIIGWRKKSAVMIFVVNVTTGWTVVGWIVALVWAVRDEPKARTPFAALRP